MFCELFRQFASQKKRKPPIARQPAPSPRLTVHIPDQIATLAALRDAEVLRSDDFDTKKAQLLDRMWLTWRPPSYSCYASSSTCSLWRPRSAPRGFRSITSLN
jgi:hypothetical protein